MTVFAILTGLAAVISTFIIVDKDEKTKANPQPKEEETSD